ncbi:MAG: class D sortase [Candidatus Acidiferrales bacterium]
MTRVERSLFAIGLAFLAMWGTAKLQSVVFSHAALAEFDANQAKNAEAGSPVMLDPATGSKVDFTVWSIQRVQAYKDSLLQKVDTPLAVLRIPKIHLEVPVFNDTDDLTLNRGVGRILGTAQLGAGGNLGIAGHRDGFFRGLKDIGQGDLIELLHSGQTDSYVVDKVQIVNPKDVYVLDATPTPVLTLVTCFPFYFVGSAPQRYIVSASLRNSSPSEEGSNKGPNYKDNPSNKETVR